MGIHTVYLDQHPHLYGKLVIVDCYDKFIKIIELSHYPILCYGYIIKETLKKLPEQPCVVHGSSSVVSPSHLPPGDSSNFFVLIFVLVHAVVHSPICHSFHSQSITVTKY